MRRLLAVILACLSASAAQASGLVVLDVPARKITADEASALSTSLRRQAFAAAGKVGLQMVPTEVVAGALQDANLDPKACEDECLGEAAKATQADYVLASKPLRSGKKISLRLSLYDKDGGLVGAADSKQADDVKALSAALPEALDKVLALPQTKSAPEKTAAEKKPLVTTAPLVTEAPRPQPPPAQASKSARAAPAAATGSSVEGKARDEADNKVSIPLLVLGGLALGAGVVLDAVPDTAHDHKVTGADFIPVALYVVGAAAITFAITR